MRATTSILCLLLLVLPGCARHDAALAPVRAVAASEPSPGQNVVVLVIDGPRGTEAFQDPSHANVPRTWNELRPQGTFFESFLNLGETLTNPGHGSIATGTWQHIDNQGLTRPDRPTEFEYLRRGTGAPALDAFLVAGKAKLEVISHSTDPEYGAGFGATVHAGLGSDAAVYADLVSVLATHHPRLAFGCFSEVDIRGHEGNFQAYVDAIRNVDSLVVKVWNTLQTDSFYAGRTYLIVTSDHGRHDDGHGGFQNHGDGCDGCRRIPCLIVGPGIRVNHTVVTPYAQKDIGPTVGRMLGVATPKSDAVVLEEAFESVVTGVRDDP